MINLYIYVKRFTKKYLNYDKKNTKNKLKNAKKCVFLIFLVYFLKYDWK